MKEGPNLITEPQFCPCCGNRYPRAFAACPRCERALTDRHAVRASRDAERIIIRWPRTAAQ